MRPPVPVRARRAGRSSAGGTIRRHGSAPRVDISDASVLDRRCYCDFLHRPEVLERALFTERGLMGLVPLGEPRGPQRHVPQLHLGVLEGLVYEVIGN